MKPIFFLRRAAALAAVTLSLYPRPAPAQAPAAARGLPAVTAGVGVPVDLSAAYSAVGLAADGAHFGAAGGIDGVGSALSATLLGPSLTWHGVPFRLGPAGARDVVSCRGDVVALPAGHYASLWLLGLGVNGAQTGRTMTVTYTDGTTDTLTQDFSDWFQPQDLPGEGRALRMPYRDLSDGSRDPRPFYLYGYGFPLDRAKTVRSLALPGDEGVKVLAVSLLAVPTAG